MMAAVRFNVAATDEARKAEVFASLERAARMGARYALTFGVDRPEHFEGFFRLMAAAVPEAERLGLKMVLKPHGGVSSGPADLLACLDRVGHPNFSIWYDPGNIIYYTGGDPVADLKPIASRVSGLCAKDCDKPKGAVMSQFGTGKVDFAGVVAVLRAAKFAGPVFVEGIQVGPTLEATAANARANREFLDRVLAATA
jgi:sugar phosphate isomerase/epimerase